MALLAYVCKESSCSKRSISNREHYWGVSDVAAAINYSLLLHFCNYGAIVYLHENMGHWYENINRCSQQSYYFLRQ